MSLFLSISGFRSHCVPDGWLKLAVFVRMTSTSHRTVAVFETEYGTLARGEYAHCKTSRTLAKALARREPPVYVTDAVLKVWFHNVSRPPDAIHVSSQQELVRACSGYLDVLAAEHNSDYSLQRALTRQQPPVYADGKVLRSWLREHMQLVRIHSAGHLERPCSCVSGCEAH